MWTPNISLELTPPSQSRTFFANSSKVAKPIAWLWFTPKNVTMKVNLRTDCWDCYHNIGVECIQFVPPLILMELFMWNILMLELLRQFGSWGKWENSGSRPNCYSRWCFECAWFFCLMIQKWLIVNPLTHPRQRGVIRSNYFGVSSKCELMYQQGTGQT